MGDVPLEDLLPLINDGIDSVQQLTLSQILHFITVASRLKDDILLTQPASVPASQPPDILPPSISAFLGDCCDLLPDFVDRCWDILWPAIWNDSRFRDRSEMLPLPSSYTSMIASHSFYPPQHACTKPGCPRTKKGLLLKKAEARQVVFYTLNNGVMPAHSIHLYGEGMMIQTRLTLTDERFSTLNRILQGFIRSGLS